MNAKENLVEAYDSWEKLTQAEGQAIQQEDWRRVSECQNSKQGLQSQIQRLTGAAQAEYLASGQDPRHLQSELAGIINTLITLENRNAGLLAGRRQAAERHRLQLDRASHNLRRVHRSYTSPTQAVWNSYS